MFGDLAKRLAEVCKLRPGRLGDINLYPDYAKLHQMGVETYDQYVSLFLATVDVDVLCMDHYPIFKPQQDSRHRYCRNLETMRMLALAEAETADAMEEEETENISVEDLHNHKLYSQ